MKKKSILVTGALGQLGNCLRKIENHYPSLVLIFKDSSKLDITNKTEILRLFESIDFDYYINCAAYTDVNEAQKVQIRLIK
jgi:dTDP-4-dehydrorhamnose reductase